MYTTAAVRALLSSSSSSLLCTRVQHAHAQHILIYPLPPLPNPGRFVRSSSAEDDLTFCYIRNSQIQSNFTCSNDTSRCAHVGVVQRGSHGREITCVAYATFPAWNCPMIVSAGEDCQIKLKPVLDAKSRLGDACTDASAITTTIKAQSTSIRTLSVLGRMVFSGGGKGMIKCWHLTMLGTAPNATCVADWPPPNYTEDNFRVMSISTYITDPSEVDEAEAASGICTHVGLVVACSDGTVRVMQYNDTSKRFKETAVSPVQSRCPISTAFITVCGVQLAITGSTAGTVSVWDISATADGASPESVRVLEERLCLRHHQSGVNTIQVAVLPGNRALFACQCVSVGTGMQWCGGSGSAYM